MGKEERVKVPAARAVNVVPSWLHLNMYENVGIAVENQQINLNTAKILKWGNYRMDQRRKTILTL